MKAPRRPTVLLVEDDALNLELLQAVLESTFTVLTANDVEQGLELARRDKPDCILMDVQLPGTDGLEATRQLRADPRTAAIPVVAVTAHVKKEDERRCLEAGCVLHLPKPVDTRTLADTVQDVIEQARGGAGSGRSQ
jgi:CheY-like chemotaxis protein